MPTPRAPGSHPHPLVPAQAGTQCWIPAGACSRAGGDGNERSVVHARSSAHDSQIQLSNSQFQTALANAPPPVFFTGAPGRPVFASLPSPAEAREWSAVRRNQQVQRLAALTCLCDRHVRHTALHRRLFCPRDRASGRGHLIQAAFAALHPRLVQPLKAAPRSWSGRRPGASRRRGCETTPAGAASDPALHDAS